MLLLLVKDLQSPGNGSALTLTLRRWASSAATPKKWTESTPIAKRLAATNLYSRSTRGKGKKKPKGDARRVNIVSDKLCDDLLKYISPSLERHKGCDIVDINPGCGLFSKKLHDLLQPRSHLLMEPDAEVYAPFLKPLTKKPSTRLFAKSGILWNELSEVLRPEHLPHQIEIPRGIAAAPPRNDTLLVVANLAYSPPKAFGQFKSVTQMVLYQFLSSIRGSSLFQKYGQVRMLLWTSASDKDGLVPRTLQRRKKMALDGEHAAEWIRELTTGDPEDHFKRAKSLDLAVGRKVLERMASAGITMPKGRETALMRNLLEEKKIGKPVETDLVMINHPSIAREIKQLETELAADDVEDASGKRETLGYLHWRLERERRSNDRVAQLFAERNAFLDDYEAGRISKEDMLAAATAWNNTIDRFRDSWYKEFKIVADNLHVATQDPPVLHWDRRTFEPLLVKDDEFYPNVPLSLVDIQPKAMHPLLREMGPNTAGAANFFEIIQRNMITGGMVGVSKSLEGVWPGAGQSVATRVTSLHDRKRGGMPLDGHGELRSRVLNEVQWCEILERWMEWPFRPTLAQLVGRLEADYAGTADDELSEE